MHTGTLVAPAVSQVATLSRATNHGTPTVARNRRRRLLQVLAGPANTSPFHRPPHTGRPDHATGPGAQADLRCPSRH